MGRFAKSGYGHPRSSSLEQNTREVQFYLTSLNSNAQLIGRAIRKQALKMRLIGLSIVPLQKTLVASCSPQP